MINYTILAQSQNYYESQGFKRIESPWTVTKAVSDITRPSNSKEFQLKDDREKVLVASGEQSFLYLYLKGFLPKGQFQTTTPCFRDEPFDTTHTKYFIKNELIKTDDTSQESLLEVVKIARLFFEKYLGQVDFEYTGENQIDLSYRGIELGSYGIRQCDFLRWVFATGLSEPRFSSVLTKYGLSQYINS